MPISSVSTDYSGRTLDISIFQGVDPSGEATVTPSFGIGSYCTGIQKLIQRYSIMMLTELGSQVNFPTFGTTLLTQLNDGNYQLNIADLSHIFNFASAGVIDTLVAYQQSANVTIPEDEQIATAMLNSVTFSNNTVYFSVQIYPVAQPSVVYILPLPVN